MKMLPPMAAYGSSVMRLGVFLLLLVSSVQVAQAAVETQRMLIESQNFSIPAGGKAEPRAMCLDSGAASPTPATRFAKAPQTLGDIRVILPDGRQMDLQKAIDKRIVEVRGAQGYASVEFRSLLPSGDIKVEVRRNSVVVPESDHATDDLKGLPELQATHLKSQQELWASRSQQIAAARGSQAALTQEVMVTGARAATPRIKRPVSPQQTQVSEGDKPQP